MKNMKKVLAVILAVVLLICACSFSAYSAILADSYKAAGSVDEQEETTEPVTHITYNENDEFDTYIYFSDRNTFDGEVYLFSWNEDGDMLSGEWPGTKLHYIDSTISGWEIFRIGIPEDCQGIVLSNGGNLYTEDITDFNLNSECWLTGNKDEWNRYRVYNKYNNDNNIQIPTEDNDPNRKETLWIADTLGWGTCYLFAWDSNGNDIFGAWPGTRISETRVNEFGETEFVCQIPKTAVGIVVNNGNGAHSADITDFSTYDGYWFDGTTHESGAYNVKGFVIEIPATDATVEPAEKALGDINGDGIITVADATMVQEYAAELREFTADELKAADTNRDGIITVADATLIQQYAAEMIDEF